MIDQATGLRALAAQRRASSPARRLGQATRVIAITSGKGGVGKTSVTINLAVLLARWGKRVIVLDCDLGTANVDVMLGLHSRYNLQHVLSRERRLEDVMVNGPAGVQVISGGSGLQELADLTESQREALLRIFQSLDGQADVVLLDTGAGISANVLRFVVAAGEAIVVTTPEPPAVADAYALIKVASQHAFPVPGAWPAAPGPWPLAAGPLRLRLVVNQAVNEVEARETARNITTVARRFLNVTVEPFGSIPADPAVSRAVRAQTPLVEAFPRSPAALACERLAWQLLSEERVAATSDGLSAANGAAGGITAAVVSPATTANGVHTTPAGGAHMHGLNGATGATGQRRPVGSIGPVGPIGQADGPVGRTIGGLSGFIQRMLGFRRIS